MEKIMAFIMVIIINLMETWKNKLAAIILLAGGIVPIIIDKDGSFLIFVSLFAIPLLLANKNLIS